MKKGTKVKVYIDGKYIECNVDSIEEAKGFKGYKYLKYFVIMPDKTIKQFTEFNVIVISDVDKTK